MRTGCSTAVVDPVGAAAARREGDYLAFFKLSLTVQRAERGLAGDDHQELLVGMVDVEGEA